MVQPQPGVGIVAVFNVASSLRRADGTARTEKK
jgi:hypothetical protein